MSSAENRPAHLDTSELGTKEYWDRLYAGERSNHAADPSDIGTVWFDDSDAEARIVDLADAGGLGSGPLPPCDTASLLLALRADGWAGRALGVDYNPQSVSLARQVAAAAGSADVEFTKWDVVAGPFDAVLSGPQAAGWDVVLDKGTFDAVSLLDQRDARGRRLCEGYRDRVLGFVRPRGLFVVTSCNWTEDELARWFAVPARAPACDGLELVGRVQYRTFSFGGAKGQMISTLCFQRVAKQ